MPSPRWHKSPNHRTITAVFGVLLALIGTWLLVQREEGQTGQLLAALILTGLGLEAVVSVLRGKRSLLSRLGPLP